MLELAKAITDGLKGVRKPWEFGRPERTTSSSQGDRAGLVGPRVQEVTALSEDRDGPQQTVEAERMFYGTEKIAGSSGQISSAVTVTVTYGHHPSIQWPLV